MARCTANDTESYYEALITNENASHSHRLINSFRPQCDGEKVFNYYIWCVSFMQSLAV